MLDIKPTLEMIDTVDGVIRALGGTRNVMDMTEAKTPQVVNNWRSLNRFASNTYLVLLDALEARNMTAPPRLWGLKQPKSLTADQ